jgi:hypothetical protein
MSVGVGVAVFILNAENKILIGKRKPAGVWALAGGKVLSSDGYCSLTGRWNLEKLQKKLLFVRYRSNTRTHEL